MTLKANLEDERARPTVEDIEQFISDYRTTAFVLDIETDSTIQADENAEKQRRGEFMGMLAQLIPQLAGLIATEPGSAEFCGEMLKFAVAPFRAGRSLDGSIDNLVEQIEMKASERVGKGDPKIEADKKKLEAEVQLETKKIEAKQATEQQQTQIKMAEMQNNNNIEMGKQQNELRLALFEAETKRQESLAKIQQINAKSRQDAEKHAQKIIEGNQKQQLATQAAQQDQVDRQARRDDMAARSALSERNQTFKERQAAMRPFPTVRNG
jgi:hypothetical protein